MIICTVSEYLTDANTASEDLTGDNTVSEDLTGDNTASEDLTDALNLVCVYTEGSKLNNNILYLKLIRPQLPNRGL